VYWIYQIKNSVNGKLYIGKTSLSLIDRFKAHVWDSKKRNPFYGKKHTDESKRKMSDTKKVMYRGANNPFWGKTHSEATRQRMSLSHKLNSSGVNNSRYIHTIDNNKIKEEYLKCKNGAEVSRRLGIPEHTVARRCKAMGIWQTSTN
jgi:NUMOD3 motif/GIY-YIG catalytic domain